MTPKNTDTRPVFACISDENGILEYAGRHTDLADAIIGYAEEVCMPIGLAYQSYNCTWYEFNVPPKNWEDWNGEMSSEEYDALCEAADHKHHDADHAVIEARARLDDAIDKLERMEVSRLTFGGAR